MANRPRLTLILAVALGAPAAAAPDDGFAAFWTRFAAAAVKNDVRALDAMTQLDPGPGDVGAANAKRELLDRGTRRCLARSRPERAVDADGDVTYDTACFTLLYTFSKKPGGWKLTGIDADD